MKLRLSILIFILAGCNYINTAEKRADEVNSYKELFFNNRQVFEGIVAQIKSDERLRAKANGVIMPEEFDELTLRQLRQLKIRHLTIKSTLCDELEIEFRTHWTEYPIGQMYLTKPACEDALAGKGNYWNDGSFIDVWGLGDDWLIWTDSDFI
jgi:hypothetical protein